jgi:hypothetical protein
MDTSEASAQWWYISEGAKTGPVSDQELRGLACRGELGPRALVYKQGTEKLTYAGRLQTLSSFFSAYEREQALEPPEPTTASIGRTPEAMARSRAVVEAAVVEALVERQTLQYEERETLKQSLTNDRGMSNALAEMFLDRQDWPRPPGWHSVFFYPDSNQPRWQYVAIAACLAIGVWIIF